MCRFEGFHLHVIIHHDKLMLQIGSCKGTALHLGNAAVFEIGTEHSLHDNTDAALALAAVAFQ